GQVRSVEGCWGGRAQGENGGFSSSTDRYYSFEVGQTHVVCLDTEDTITQLKYSEMQRWLETDLQIAKQNENIHFLIAFWHRPPHSKGTHDSDTEEEMVIMRQYLTPTLEEYGVDLVISGHSHVYERTNLIDGHYMDSSTFDRTTMQFDAASREWNPCGGEGVLHRSAYVKESLRLEGRQGTVYVVAGTGGRNERTNKGMDHPAMNVSLVTFGSVIISVEGNRLESKYIDNEGTVVDHFAICKGGDEMCQFEIDPLCLTYFPPPPPIPPPAPLFPLPLHRFCRWSLPAAPWNPPAPPLIISPASVAPPPEGTAVEDDESAEDGASSSNDDGTGMILALVGAVGGVAGCGGAGIAMFLYFRKSRAATRSHDVTSHDPAGADGVEGSPVPLLSGMGKEERRGMGKEERHDSPPSPMPDRDMHEGVNENQPPSPSEGATPLLGNDSSGETADRSDGKKAGRTSLVPGFLKFQSAQEMPKSDKEAKALREAKRAQAEAAAAAAATPVPAVPMQAFNVSTEGLNSEDAVRAFSVPSTPQDSDEDGLRRPRPRYQPPGAGGRSYGGNLPKAMSTGNTLRGSGSLAADWDFLDQEPEIANFVSINRDVEAWGSALLEEQQRGSRGQLSTVDSVPDSYDEIEDLVGGLHTPQEREVADMEKGIHSEDEAARQRREGLLVIQGPTAAQNGGTGSSDRVQITKVEYHPGDTSLANAPTLRANPTAGLPAAGPLDTPEGPIHLPNIHSGSNGVGARSAGFGIGHSGVGDPVGRGSPRGGGSPGALKIPKIKSEPLPRGTPGGTGWASGSGADSKQKGSGPTLVKVAEARSDDTSPPQQERGKVMVNRVGGGIPREPRTLEGGTPRDQANLAAAVRGTSPATASMHIPREPTSLAEPTVKASSKAVHHGVSGWQERQLEGASQEDQFAQMPTVSASPERARAQPVLDSDSQLVEDELKWAMKISGEQSWDFRDELKPQPSSMAQDLPVDGLLDDDVDDIQDFYEGELFEENNAKVAAIYAKGRNRQWAKAVRELSLGDKDQYFEAAKDSEKLSKIVVVLKNEFSSAGLDLASFEFDDLAKEVIPKMNELLYDLILTTRLEKIEAAIKFQKAGGTTSVPSLSATVIGREGEGKTYHGWKKCPCDGKSATGGTAAYCMPADGEGSDETMHTLALCHIFQVRAMEEKVGMHLSHVSLLDNVDVPYHYHVPTEEFPGGIELVPVRHYVPSMTIEPLISAVACSFEPVTESFVEQLTRGTMLLTTTLTGGPGTLGRRILKWWCLSLDRGGSCLVALPPAVLRHLHRTHHRLRSMSRAEEVEQPALNGDHGSERGGLYIDDHYGMDPTAPLHRAGSSNIADILTQPLPPRAIFYGHPSYYGLELQSETFDSDSSYGSAMDEVD
ncbi:hypothetical protein CYMTET_27105, partial [Cymbomonas tetramitiformis]